MKIAIIIRFLTRTGGATREAFMLARLLQQRGHATTLYTFAYDPATCFPGEFGDIKIQMLTQDYSRWRARLFRLPIFGGAINRWDENKKARGLALLIDPHTDVLNPHDQISVHAAYYFKKRMQNIPSVWMLNDLHIARWSIFDDPSMGRVARSRIKRLVARLRDAHENKKFFTSQDRVAVIVDSMRQRVKKYLGLDAVVVRSGVDLDAFSYRPREGIHNKRIRLLSQGIFYSYRRFEDVIRAVKILADRGYDPSLKIVGDYRHKDTARQYHATLAALARSLGVAPRIAFAGVISETALAQSYQEADIFVFASIQTWGIAIFEAMASGTPVVLARLAGAGEILEDRKNVLLADTGDAHDIVRAIQELVEEPSLYQRISNQANAMVRATLSWEQYADRMTQLFEDALAASSRSLGTALKKKYRAASGIASMERAKFIFAAVMAYFLLPIFWLRIRRRKQSAHGARVPRILVIPLLTRIGDLVCATPVFRAIKTHIPQSYLAVMASVKAAGIIRRNPRIDELIVMDEDRFCGFWGRWRLLHFLRAQRFDWVISLTNNPFNNLYAYYSAAPHRVKTVVAERSLAERCTDFFQNIRMLYEHHTFLPLHYLGLLEPLGIRESRVVKEVFCTDAGDRRAAEFFAARHIMPQDFVIGISLSAGNLVKEWGDVKFAALAAAIVERHGAVIIFIGARADEDRIDAMLENLGSAARGFKAVGFSLEDLPCLMKRLQLFIAVDTGPIYIAHALGIPLVDIVGPVDWREQPPEDEKSIVVRPPGGIAPSCFVLKRPGSRKSAKQALEATSVDAVLAAASGLITKRADKGTKEEGEAFQYH